MPVIVPLCSSGLVEMVALLWLVAWEQPGQVIELLLLPLFLCSFFVCADELLIT